MLSQATVAESCSSLHQVTVSCAVLFETDMSSVSRGLRRVLAGAARASSGRSVPGSGDHARPRPAAGRAERLRRHRATRVELARIDASLVAQPERHRPDEVREVGLVCIAAAMRSMSSAPISKRPRRIAMPQFGLPRVKSSASRRGRIGASPVASQIIARRHGMKPSFCCARTGSPSSTVPSAVKAWSRSLPPSVPDGE